MDHQLKDSRVLVTGGSRGIGRALVDAFAAAGARVLTCHRSAPPEPAPGAADGGPIAVRADLASPAGATALAEAAADRLGGLDVLVNNVGADASAPLAELDEDDWQRVMDLNATAAYRVTRAMLPLLADGASIVNIGSAAAFRGRPHSAHYSASKAALLGLTRGLCKELGPRGIRVNLVSPGVVLGGDGSGPPPPVAARLTAMTALGRLGTPEDVAGPVLFLAGAASRHVSGATITVDGGI